MSMGSTYHRDYAKRSAILNFTPDLLKACESERGKVSRGSESCLTKLWALWRKQGNGWSTFWYMRRLRPLSNGKARKNSSQRELTSHNPKSISGRLEQLSFDLLWFRSIKIFTALAIEFYAVVSWLSSRRISLVWRNNEETQHRRLNFCVPRTLDCLQRK